MATINTQLPQWYIEQLPTQQSLAQMESQISANLLHGIQARQRNRQLAIQESEEQRAQELFPLQMEANRNKLKMQSIELSDAMRQQQDAVQAREAGSQLTQFVRQALIGGTAADDQTLAGALDILGRYPSSAQYPVVQTALKELQAARALKSAQQELEAKQSFQRETFDVEEAGRLERARIMSESREAVAETSAAARIESAELSAQSRIQSAQQRASNWGNHARFTEFNAAIQRARTTALSDEDFALKVEDAERRYAPAGMPPGGITPQPVAPTGADLWQKYLQQRKEQPSGEEPKPAAIKPRASIRRLNPRSGRLETVETDDVEGAKAELTRLAGAYNKLLTSISRYG